MTLTMILIEAAIRVLVFSIIAALCLMKIIEIITGWE